MPLKSSFRKDLLKEQNLSKLLDDYYASRLKNYNFKRVFDKRQQLNGVDVVFIHSESGQNYFIDEKAQLDYVNEDLPTFAFEILYLKNNLPREGWLFDASKKTDFYSLVTGIFMDGGHNYTFCKITLVNRQKLIAFLEKKAINKNSLFAHFKDNDSKHGKMVVDNLDDKKEGYLYHSKSNKAEQPLNLVLRLNWLIENNIAKRLA